MPERRPDAKSKKLVMIGLGSRRATETALRKDVRKPSADLRFESSMPPRAGGVSTAEEALIPWLLRTLLPNGGYAVAMGAYFDESGSHAGSPLLSVAGYLLSSEQCIRLDREWREALASAGLSHFHMADCAHGVGEFKGKTFRDRDELARRLISIIKLRVNCGIVASICEGDFQDARPVQWQRGGAYTVCVLYCVAEIGNWVVRHSYRDPVSFFLEAGHRLQSEANDAIASMMRVDRLREAVHYKSHSFVLKNEAPAVQAADLLAWEWHREYLNIHGAKRRPRRRSLESLLEAPHVHAHLSRDYLTRYFQSALRAHGLISDSEDRSLS